MTKHIATAIFFLGIMVLAWMYRYEPIDSPINSMQATLLFDRWSHHVCIVGAGIPDGRTCGVTQSDELTPSEKAMLEQIKRDLQK